MVNNILKFVLAMSVVSSAYCPCLADNNDASSAAGTESQPFMSVANASSVTIIRNKIQANPQLSDEAKQNVNVAFKDGSVELTGTVPKYSDRDIINNIASASGADSVRDRIKVKTAKKKQSSSTQ